MATTFYHIIVFVFFLASFLVTEQEFFNNENEINHAVVLSHPGLGKQDSATYDLIEKQDEKGNTVEYAVYVESVICADHICKIVPVKMFWHPSGKFKKYDLDQGVELEKGDGEPFEPKDYARLTSILENSESPFKDLTYADITNTKVHGEVDAMSGATAVILDNDKTIIGASWTCFTLWHWAYGDVVDQIRKINGSRWSAQDLVAMINTDNELQQQLVLEELNRRKYYGTKVLEAVIEEAGGFNKNNLNLLISYFEHSSAPVYFKSIFEAYQSATPNQRVRYLNALLNSRYDIPINYFDKYISFVESSSSFHEVDFFFSLLKKKEIKSPALSSMALRLLNGDFLIARSAYYYLVDLPVTSSQEKSMARFERKHSDSL